MVRWFWLIVISALLSVLSILTVRPAQAQEDFLPVEKAFSLTTSREADGQLRLSWAIAKGYYLYRNQIKVEGEPAGSVQEVSIPTGKTKTDEFFGTTETYHDRLEVWVRAPQAQALNLRWQGCADAGICYPPQTLRVSVADIAAEPAGGAGGFSLPRITGAAGFNLGLGSSKAAPTPAATLGEDQSLADRLARASLGWMLLVFFGLGLLMTFTPCVLPMVPIVSSLVAGSGAGPRRGFFLSLAFVLPMALTYAAVGAAAALAGANLQAALQNPWVLGAFGLIFVALALAMFGFYELQLPAFLRERLDSASQRQRGGNVGGAAAMGVLSALLVGPCMTAPLAGALLYIGNTGDVLTGGAALFAMGLGMGVPLLLVGTLGARLLPRPGAWMNRVKALFGFVLLATAIVFLARVLPPAVTLGLWGAWLLTLALGLLALASQLGDTGSRLLPRSAALVLGLWGGAMVVGAAGGGSDPLRPLAFVSAGANSAQAASVNDFMARFAPVTSQQALAERLAEAGARGQWTLVDFYADWCVSCKVIEREVFGDPRVQQALAGVQLLRPDVSAQGPNALGLMRAYGIQGPPTMLLIGPDGQERRAERVIGELKAGEFLARLARAGKV